MSKNWLEALFDDMAANGGFSVLADGDDKKKDPPEPVCCSYNYASFHYSGPWNP